MFLELPSVHMFVISVVSDLHVGELRVENVEALQKVEVIGSPKIRDCSTSTRSGVSSSSLVTPPPRGTFVCTHGWVAKRLLLHLYYYVLRKR